MAGGKLGVMVGGYNGGSAIVFLRASVGVVGDSGTLLLLLGIGFGVFGMGGRKSLGGCVVRV